MTVSSLFYSVLNASFHGSIVIAAVLLLRLLLRKAPKKYICYLWLLAGLRLLMPFEIQSELSLQPQSVPDTMIRWEQPAPLRVELDESSQRPEQPDAVEADSAPAQPAATAETPSAPANVNFSPASLVPFLWITVAAAFLVYSLCGYVNLKRKVRRAVKIPGGWESDGIETAFILGFIRPQIYIPVGMAPETRKHILAHERTHLDKGDHWIKMIGFLALALHWFNPLVWLAYILLCKDIEMACDERVVQFMELSERKEYSTALLNRSTSRIHYAASPVAFGEVSVKSRIQSILNYRKPGFWVGLLSVLAIAFVTVCLVTSPTKPTESGDNPSLSEKPGSTPSASAEFVPATQPPMEENPDWGLSLLAHAESSTTVRLYYGVDVDDIPWDGVSIYKDVPYWIEAWNGESWEPLPLKVQIPVYSGSSSAEMCEDYGCGSYDYDDLDLSLLYGALPEGDYRVGIRPRRLGESAPFYAWFHVYANALTGEEAEAVARCEDALNALAQRYYYTATISESTKQGTLLPVTVIQKDYSVGQINAYYGEFCYNSYNCGANDYAMTAWMESFQPLGNKHISFPKRESKISPAEITFQAAWTDIDGKAFQETYTYRFNGSGNLQGIDLLTRTTDDDGMTVQSQRSLEVSNSTQSYIKLVEDLTPKDSYDSQLDSPWKIFFRVDDDLLKTTAGDVWMSVDAIGVSNYTTDSSYWLERKENGEWKKLPSQAGDPSWGSETYHLRSRNLCVDQVDWTPYYGQLDAGLYRMGKRFYQGEESIIQYAEFYINSKGGVHGDGGEEAFARVRKAIETLCGGSYCITEEYQGGFHPSTRLNAIYWKSGNVCVTDHYNIQKKGYSHSSLTLPDDRNADLFYNQWTQAFTVWDSESYQLFFPKDVSVISDREITFAGAHANSGFYNGTPYYDNLNRYSFFFDENGDLIRAEYSYGFDSTGGVYSLTVQQKSEAEIKAWVDKIQAEQETT